MRIAVTSKGKELDSEVDPRFGRADFILIVDTFSFGVEVVDNSENANAFKGAGIQAASQVCDKGVHVVLTGNCGPNAFKALHSAGIRVANDQHGTVREAVSAFNEGRVSFATKANVDGYW